jgi:hypothetical protein
METTNTTELILPLTYEETVERVGADIAKMAEFIVPVTEFEEKIIQIVADMRRCGYLLFLYGISGVGKSRVHPWLTNIRPDILVDVSGTKYICIEMHYTTKTAPNVIAKYVLDKLNKYMKQIESLYESGQLPLLDVTRSI